MEGRRGRPGVASRVVGLEGRGVCVWGGSQTSAHPSTEGRGGKRSRSAEAAGPERRGGGLRGGPELVGPGALRGGGDLEGGAEFVAEKPTAPPPPPLSGSGEILVAQSRPLARERAGEGAAAAAWGVPGGRPSLPFPLSGAPGSPSPPLRPQLHTLAWAQAGRPLADSSLPGEDWRRGSPAARPARLAPLQTRSAFPSGDEPLVGFLRTAGIYRQVPRLRLSGSGKPPAP